MRKYIIFILLLAVFCPLPARAAYPGDLSKKFIEKELFRFDSASKMYGYFTTDHKQVTISQTLPASANLSGDLLTITSRTGIIIDNPAKGNNFYKIEMVLGDTGQNPLTAFLSVIDNLWSNTVQTNGASTGIDTTKSANTYWYEHSKLKKVGDIGWDGTPVTQAQYDFSAAAQSKFIRRRTGDIKIELYVTPVGIYPQIDGANFASFPDLYTGSYVLPPQIVNYLVLGKWDNGTLPVTFKSVRIVDLDKSLTTVDEINAHFMHKVFQDPKFISDLNGISGTTCDSTNYHTALWAAFLFRGFDYYFKSYNVLRVRQLVDCYLSYMEPYFDQNINRYRTFTNYCWNGNCFPDTTNWINFTFINTVHTDPYIAWALSGYLTDIEKQRLKAKFSQVADKIMDYTRPYDSDSRLTFPLYRISYLGDTQAEEISWPLTFLTGYLMNYPNESPRNDRLKDFIKFYGFITLSTSDSDNGTSMEQAFFGMNKEDFFKQQVKAFGAGNNTLTIWKNYNGIYQKIALKSAGIDQNLTKYAAKYMFPDGKIDNHAFHPSLNYGTGEVDSVLITRNSLSKLGIQMEPLTFFLGKAYQGTIINYSDPAALRLNKYIPMWKQDASGGYTQPPSNEIAEDQYVYDTTDGFISVFNGKSKPSHLEDWGNSSVNWQLFEHYGDIPLATQVALNSYYRFFTGTGKLFCDSSPGQNCHADSRSFFNHTYPNALYSMLFSSRTGFNPQETVSPSVCTITTRTLYWDGSNQTNIDYITKNASWYQRLDNTWWSRGDLAEDPHYSTSPNAPCYGKISGQCSFSTRAYYRDFTQANRFVETITVGPKYYNWSTDIGWWPAGNNDIASSSRYKENIHAPCYGKSSGTCQFTTRDQYVESGTNKTIESITVGPNIYNWSSDIGWWVMANHDLTQASNFYTQNSNAPCYGKSTGQCTLSSTLRYYDSTGTLVESVTAGERYYNYSFNATGWWPAGDNRMGVTIRNNEPDGPCVP